MRKLCILLAILTNSYLVHAQKTITGLVKDAKTNQPIPGVSVKIKGTKSGAITGYSGSVLLKEMFWNLQ